MFNILPFPYRLVLNQFRTQKYNAIMRLANFFSIAFSIAFKNSPQTQINTGKNKLSKIKVRLRIEPSIALSIAFLRFPTL